MSLPNFLIIGAAKAGTNALYHYLRQHPQVYMSPWKEPKFFAFESEADLGFRAANGKDAPVNAKPTNLAIAIAMLANNAITTDLVPWAWMSLVAGRLPCRPCRPEPLRGRSASGSRSGSCAVASSTAFRRSGRLRVTVRTPSLRLARTVPSLVSSLTPTAMDYTFVPTRRYEISTRGSPLKKSETELLAAQWDPEHMETDPEVLERYVRYEVDAERSVATITFDRPDKANALPVAAFERIRRDGYAFTILPRSGRLQGIGVAIRKGERVMGCLSMRFIRSALTEDEAGRRYGTALNALATAIATDADR